MFNVALIGFGGIARIHAKNLLLLEKEGKAKLVAAFDVKKEAFEKKVGINISNDDDEMPKFHAYTDIDEMFANEKIDGVVICLPTFLHKEYTMKLLGRGYHVFCEKPMATNYNDCMEMLDLAKRVKRRLMIGQVARVEPPYAYVKKLIDEKTYGAPISAFFERLSSPPLWGWNAWHTNKKMFGSCLHDMHIHDVDMTQYLFGTPREVFCKTKDGFGKMDGVSTLLMYDNKFTSTIIADWSLVNVPFSATYRIGFEKASVIFNGTDVTVYPYEGDSFKAELDSKNGYYRELEYFADIENRNDEEDYKNAYSAAETIRIIELICESADAGGVKLPYFIKYYDTYLGR